VEKLPTDKDKLQILLSNYDSVILANVAASDVAADKAFDDREGGAGPSAGAAGGDPQQHPRPGCRAGHDRRPRQLRQPAAGRARRSKAAAGGLRDQGTRDQGKGGLVLIMHASEAANGNYWQKQIAKLSIRKLSTSDEIGVLFYDFTTGTVRSTSDAGDWRQAGGSWPAWTPCRPATCRTSIRR
jgi:hypothetical protein